MHRYTASVAWEGSTGLGYEHYGRTHTASAGEARVTMTTGERPMAPGELNPEQLLVMAASSCQLLWFLHVAAVARIDVIAYEDEPEGLMPAEVEPVRLTRITLRPRIVVRPGPSEERVRKLVDLAHRKCYVAHSLNSEVAIEARIEFTAGS